MATLQPGARWNPSRSKSFRSFWRTLVSYAFIVGELAARAFRVKEISNFEFFSSSDKTEEKSKENVVI